MSAAENRFAQLHSIARSAARSVHATAREWVDLDDLTQEGILWLLEHGNRVEHHTLPDGNLHHTLLVAEVVERALMPFVRKNRREALGYDPEPDAYSYSVKLVETVLPAVFDPTYRLPRGVQEKVASTTDPATGNNFATFVADVKRAVGEVCSFKDRQVLFARTVGGWTWDRFGEAYAQSGESFRLRYNAAVRRIVAFLNSGAVLEDSPDGDALAAELHEPAPVARVDAVTDWDVAGRDRYKPPDV